MMRMKKLVPLCLTCAVIMIFAACARVPQTNTPQTSPPTRLGSGYESSPDSPASPTPTPTLRDAPLVPDGLDKGEDGQPVLRVYDVDAQKTRGMAIEEYLEGVLAGEMRNDWPMEALKAQAIIARTFVLKFIEDKGGSSYEGADVSTDIKEAQAYNVNDVNDRIRQAIAETSGDVITHGGKLTYSWFHAHSGGVTAQAKEGLEWEGEEPSYIRSVKSAESAQAPDDVREWTASFSVGEVQEALRAMSFTFPAIETFTVGEKGPSGRVTTFLINGTPVTAPSLRVRLDSTKFKSTLLTDVRLKDGQVTFTGSGYGHGVGLSQWGAYGLAEEGVSAEEIIKTYYADVDIEKAW